MATKIFLTFVFLFCGNAFAINSLDLLTATIKPKHSIVSVDIWDLTNDESVYNFNSDQLMIPASTQKLFIASSSLTKLGPNFHYTTSVETNGQVRKGTLKGNLYIRFDADPSLTTQELYSLLQQIKEQGIKKISGDVLLSAPLKRPSRAKGWAWDDLNICYAAPISGYILDKNCVTAELVPINRNRGKVHIFKDVPLKISSKMYFDPQKSQHDCEMDLNKVSINHYVLEGCHHKKIRVPLEVAIPDPQQFAIDFVAQTLSKLGIKISGRVADNKIHIISNDVHIGRVIARHQSEKLPILLQDMLLNSDNLIADTLTKKMGQLEFNTQGSFINGTRAIKKIMQSLGVDITDAVLADGSGLSRYNLVSAHQILETVKAIYYNSELKILVNSLPVSGYSGTLLNKPAFNHNPLKNIIVAKTGSMTGVNCLAGFINIPGKNKYAFVIMENGVNKQQSKKQPFEATFLKEFVKLVQDNNS